MSLLVPMSATAGAALASLSALAFVLSFPPLQIPLLPWMALVPLLAALYGSATAGRAAAIASLWSLLVALGTAAWLPAAVAGYWQQPAALGWMLLLGFSALTLALPMALFGAVSHSLAKSRAPSPWLVAAAWTAVELLRCHLFGGNSWALAGYTLAPGQAGALEWSRLPVQMAELGGVPAVSFLLVVFNAALASLAWASSSSGPARIGFDSLRRVAGPALLVAATCIAGAMRLGTIGSTGTGETVAIVQGNLDSGTAWRPENEGRNFDAYLSATSQALAASPSLVVWPESAMTFFVEDDPAYARSLARTLGETPAELLAGGPSHAGASVPRFFNSAFLFSPRGDLLGRYDKERLLPFAERFPFGSIAFLRRSFGRVREFTPGTATAPLATAIGKAGILLCNEILFEDLTIDRVRAGATFLVNLSNDGWIGDAQFSTNHLAVAMVRAIETRRPVIRSSTSGPSAIIDASGRVTRLSAAGEPAVLVGSLVPSTSTTIFVRTGNVFAVLCAAWVAIRMVRSGRNGAGRAEPLRPVLFP